MWHRASRGEQAIDLFLAECFREALRREIAAMKRDTERASDAIEARFYGDVPASLRKELIALCLGVAGHCDACIGFHMQALVKAGATKPEIEEALAVAVYMGGGPSLMYAASAVAAFDEAMSAAIAA